MYDGAKMWIRTVRGDSKHFLVKMGLHKRLAFSLFLFFLRIDELIWCIQDEVSWCVLLEDDIVLINDTSSVVSARLEMWR